MDTPTEKLESLSYIFIDIFLHHNNNPRSGTTAQKYGKQIASRNKAHQLLVRGHSQYEISNIRHISQPTISRDIKQYNPLRSGRSAMGDGQYMTQIGKVLH